MSFKKFYIESFDTEVIFKPINKFEQKLTDNIQIYTFDINDHKFLIEIQLGKLSSNVKSTSGNFLKVDFSSVDEKNDQLKSDISGKLKHSAQKVFGSIINLCKKIAKANNTQYLVIVAESKSPSRVKLYKKLAQKFGTPVDEKTKEDIIKFGMSPRYSEQRELYDINIVRI